MGIQTTTADLVSAGFGVRYFTQTCQQRTDEHDRTAKLIAFLEEILAAQVCRIEFRSREGISAFGEFLHTHANRREQVDEVIDIKDVR